MRPAQSGLPARLLRRINTSSEGLSLRIGSVVSGGGVAVGPRLQQTFADGRLKADAGFLLSIKGYQAATFNVSSRPLFDGRVTVGAGIRYEGLPQEDFYGIGPDSAQSSRTSYNREGIDTQVWWAFTPRPWLQISNTVGFINTSVSRGREPGVPSIEEGFTLAAAPGMSRATDFVHAGIHLAVDRRDDPDDPRSGGFYGVELQRFTGIGDANDSFLRFRLDVRQYLPVGGFSGNDSVALRAQLAITDAQGSGTIPFYFLPRLGGSSTLRGYDTSRFVDQQALAFSAEYRWQAKKRLQIAAFVDAGQVAPSLSGFSLSQFQAAVGAGVRYRLKGAGILRLDYAVGREGGRVHAGVGIGF
jgi:outer membrane protein assembly factor BamA